MKRRLIYLHPKLLLLLSVLFLLASFYLFWANLNFYMPTRDLALRKSAAEHGFSAEDFTAYPVTFPRSDGTQLSMDDFYIARRSDRFFLAQPVKYSDQSFWSGHLYQLSPLTPWRLGSFPLWSATHQDFEQAATAEAMLVVTADPAVARISVTEHCVPLDLTMPEEELLSNYSDTADCAETAPGSGLWLVYLTVPKVPAATSWTYHTTLRAYDAHGNLLKAIDC